MGKESTKECKKLQKVVNNSRVKEILLFRNNERKLLAECLFYIYYQTTVPSQEATKIVNLLRESSTREIQPGNSIAALDEDSFQVILSRE